MGGNTRYFKAISGGALKIEWYPRYKFDARPDSENLTILEWKDSEFVPAAVGDFVDSTRFLFPVKLLNRRHRCQWLVWLNVIAVRTDVYPLLWMYVWLYLQFEWLSYRPWCNFMRFANQVGIAKTPRGSHYR